jgi:putative lipoprotein
MTRRLALALVLATSTRASNALAADPDPWISRDKALHFDVSAGIAAVGYGASAAWLVDARWKALAIGGGLALVVGAGKELVDASGVFGGDPSWKDLAWDVMGATAGLALAWSIDLLLGGVNDGHPVLAAPTVPIAAGRPMSLTLRF